MLDDFKAFVSRGNVVDLAIGVIIGAAFGKIVSSLVADVLMPPLGMVLGQVDFSGLFISLFFNTVIDFFIVALCVFLMAHYSKRLLPKPVATKACPECAEAIPLAARRCPRCTSVLVPAPAAS